MRVPVANNDFSPVTRFVEAVLTGDERAAGIRTDARENQKILYAITKRPACKHHFAHGLLAC